MGGPWTAARRSWAVMRQWGKAERLRQLEMAMARAQRGVTLADARAV